MNRILLFVLAVCLFCPPQAMAQQLSAQGQATSDLQNYLYISNGELKRVEKLVERPDIQGVQIVYNWSELEKAGGQYDFSAIERDLAILDTLHKKLFVQLQDRFFEIGAKHIPAYLLNEPPYKGGLSIQTDHAGENTPVGLGWVAQQWNAAVRERYQQLLAALAKRFDGRVFGVNLPETAVEIEPGQDTTGFTYEGYFSAEMANLAFARKVFRRSKLVQYVNFWPGEWNNDHRYMSRLFAFAEKNQVGLGGPDIVPGKKAQLQNSYPFFHRYKGKLSLVAMAVQEPTLTYTNPSTQKPFTREEFTQYARDFLGANIIFWSKESPWLSQ